MNCQKLAEILDDGDSRNLSAAERRALDTHVAGCAECRAAYGAHEAMNAMVVPTMNPVLAESCRRAFVAQPIARMSRAGGRPIVVVGLLLAGAAAAAFLGLNAVGGLGGDPEVPEVAVAAPISAEDANELATMPLTEPVEAIAEAGEPAGLAHAATGFTVGVSPLRQLSANPEVVRTSEMVYGALLDQLRKIPNLELVMLAAGEFESNVFTAGTALRIEGAVTSFSPPVEAPTSGSFGVAVAPGGVIAYEAASVGSITNLIGPGSVATTTEETRTLVLLDSRNAAVVGSADETELSAVPTALRNRIETVTGGASTAPNAETMSGVVNVIFDDNIEGIHVDLSYSTTEVGHGAMPEPEPLAYDYVLQVTSSNPDQGSYWQLIVSGRSRSGATMSAAVGAGASDPIAPPEFLAPVIAGLQDQLFPVDQATLALIEQRVLDTRLPLVDRMLELGRLKRMSERAGSASLSNAAALAGVDLLMSATDDSHRQTLLTALMGVDNSVLVQPLASILRNDVSEATRLQAALALAAFRQDSLARAALESAANVDVSAAVRQNARWGLLDTAGKREFVIARLLDTRFSDAERIEPLLLELDWAAAPPVALGSAIDANVVNELSGLLRREQQASTRANILGRLANENSPALTPLFIERLAEDEAEGVRYAALNALYTRRDQPGVRNALDRAAAEDPSPGVRRVIAVNREIQN